MARFSKVRESLQWLEHEPIVANLFSLAGDSAVYLAGGLLVGLCNILLVPLYTRTLGPREFGVYALLDITVLLVVTVTALKMDVSYLKWFADLDTSRHPELLGSMLLTGLAASAVGGGALFFFTASQAGAHWLQQPANSFAWMFLPMVVLENMQALMLTDLRARRRPGIYSTVAIVRLLVMVVASFYLLSILHAGLYGLFLGRLLGDAAAILFLLSFGIRSIALRISPSLVRPMLHFGLPLIWCVFAVMFQDAAGRYFLSRYSSLEQVGLLGAAIKIGAVFQMLVANPFGVAWGGVLFQVAKERDAQIIFSTIFNYVFLFALGLALLLSLFGATLFHIFTTPLYYSAISILPFVFLVRAMNVIEQPASTGIYLTGRTSLLALSYTVALAINLVLLRLLVPAYGVTGVVVAWLCGSAMAPALFLVFGQRRYVLSFRWRVLAPPVLLWILALVLAPFGKIDALGHRTLVEILTAVPVFLVLSFVLIRDFRALRKHLQVSAARISALEVSSQ
jgi:O-antigen/teichoic acid export membrane protein